MNLKKNGPDLRNLDPAAEGNTTIFHFPPYLAYQIYSSLYNKKKIKEGQNRDLGGG